MGQILCTDKEICKWSVETVPADAEIVSWDDLFTYIIKRLLECRLSYLSVMGHACSGVVGPQYSWILKHEQKSKSRVSPTYSS